MNSLGRLTNDIRTIWIQIIEAQLFLTIDDFAKAMDDIHNVIFLQIRDVTKQNGYAFVQGTIGRDSGSL